MDKLMTTPFIKTLSVQANAMFVTLPNVRRMKNLLVYYRLVLKMTQAMMKNVMSMVT